MAAPLLPIVVLAGLGLAAAGSRRRGTGARSRVVGRVCALAPASVSLEDASEQDRWVRCAGRTFEQVQTLAGRLTAAGRTDRASRVIALWDRRRRVEDAPPSAGSVSSATRSEIDRTMSTPDSAASSLPVESAPETVSPTPDATPAPRATHAGSRTSRRTSSHVDYGDASRAAPRGFSRTTATRLAPQLRACIRERGESQCRRRVRQFQTAAGIPVDGTYGTLTFWALMFWLGSPVTSAADQPPQPSGGLRSGVVYRAPQHIAEPVPPPASSPTPDEIAQMGRDMTRGPSDPPPHHHTP